MEAASTSFMSGLSAISFSLSDGFETRQGWLFSASGGLVRFMVVSFGSTMREWPRSRFLAYSWTLDTQNNERGRSLWPMVPQILDEREERRGMDTSVVDLFYFCPVYVSISTKLNYPEKWWDVVGRST